MATEHLPEFEKGQILAYNDYGLSLRDTVKKNESLLLTTIIIWSLLIIWLNAVM